MKILQWLKNLLFPKKISLKDVVMKNPPPTHSRPEIPWKILPADKLARYQR